MTGDVADRLRDHVRHLAYAIGPRNLQHYAALQLAEHYIAAQFAKAGYSPARHAFSAHGLDVANIEAERAAGRGAPAVVIGAHYDTVSGSPGADDNASGIAVLLELARAYASKVPARTTIRFVAFVNEEPPHFKTETMGSLVYAREAAARGERIDAMLSLESMGYYSDEPGSQQYPAPFSLFFPDRGNFLAMVSNFRSTPLLLTARAAFTAATDLPVIASPAPERIAGVGWSDHWAFWQQRVRAIMLTDTVPFRNPHYHAATDTPETLDYGRLAAAFAGCLGIVDRLAMR